MDHLQNYADKNVYIKLNIPPSQDSSIFIDGQSIENLRSKLKAASEKEYLQGFENATHHLYKKAFQVWFLCSTQPLNCCSQIWLNPMIHLTFAILKHHLYKLGSRLNIMVLHIFIRHYLCITSDHNSDHTEHCIAINNLYRLACLIAFS